MDGKGEITEDWVISRVCEEFYCLPDQAKKAIDNDVGGLIFKIIDLRAYAKAKEIYDHTKMEDRPKNASMERVSEITMRLAKAEINRKIQEGNRG